MQWRRLAPTHYSSQKCRPPFPPQCLYASEKGRNTVVIDDVRKPVSDARSSLLAQNSNTPGACHLRGPMVYPLRTRGVLTGLCVLIAFTQNGLLSSTSLTAPNPGVGCTSSMTPSAAHSPGPNGSVQKSVRSLSTVSRISCCLNIRSWSCRRRAKHAPLKTWW